MVTDAVCGAVDAEARSGCRGAPIAGADWDSDKDSFGADSEEVDGPVPDDAGWDIGGIRQPVRRRADRRNVRVMVVRTGVDRRQSHTSGTVDP